MRSIIGARTFAVSIAIVLGTMFSVGNTYVTYFPYGVLRALASQAYGDHLPNWMEHGVMAVGMYTVNIIVGIVVFVIFENIFASRISPPVKNVR